MNSQSLKDLQDSLRLITNITITIKSIIILVLII